MTGTPADASPEELNRASRIARLPISVGGLGISSHADVLYCASLGSHALVGRHVCSIFPEDSASTVLPALPWLIDSNAKDLERIYVVPDGSTMINTITAASRQQVQRQLTRLANQRHAKFVADNIPKGPLRALFCARASSSWSNTVLSVVPAYQQRYSMLTNNESAWLCRHILCLPTGTGLRRDLLPHGAGRVCPACTSRGVSYENALIRDNHLTHGLSCLSTEPGLGGAARTTLHNAAKRVTTAILTPYFPPGTTFCDEPLLSDCHMQGDDPRAKQKGDLSIRTPDGHVYVLDFRIASKVTQDNFLHDAYLDKLKEYQYNTPGPGTTFLAAVFDVNGNPHAALASFIKQLVYRHAKDDKAAYVRAIQQVKQRISAVFARVNAFSAGVLDRAISTWPAGHHTAPVTPAGTTTPAPAGTGVPGPAIVAALGH